MPSDSDATGPNAPVELNLMSLFTRARQRMLEELSERMRELGFDDLRPAFSSVFESLTLDDRGDRLVDLAAHAQITPQSMSELVASLEQLGYVERIPDQDDGRSRRVRWTERGHQAGQAAVREMHAIDARWVEWLGFPPGRHLHIALERALRLDGERRRAGARAR
jgi:DNA-binding MarR family transcriptional regulator